MSLFVCVGLGGPNLIGLLSYSCPISGDQDNFYVFKALQFMIPKYYISKDIAQHIKHMELEIYQDNHP